MNVTKLREIRYYFKIFVNVDCYHFLFSGLLALKFAYFIFQCCGKHSANRYNNGAITLTVSFRLFIFKRVWVDLHEHWNIKILLKHVGTFQFTLNPDTITDTGPTEVSARISSLNMYLTSFCTP
jgi:hypothetical protein